jgi:hypothetical protein
LWWNKSIPKLVTRIPLVTAGFFCLKEPMSYLQIVSNSRQSNPQTMAESQRIAQEGGNVARDARRTMERRLGRSVVSPERASDYIKPIETQDTDAMMLLDSE